MTNFSTSELNIKDMFTPRIEKKNWLMLMAWLSAVRATCKRGRCGAVIADKYGIIIATGYNGTSHNEQIHCYENGSICTDKCHAIHAEENAILHMDANQKFKAHAVYVTCSPCLACAKLLIHELPNLRHVYYATKHRNPEKRQGILYLIDILDIEELKVPDLFADLCLIPATD